MELSEEVKQLICCSVVGCGKTNRDDVITKRNGVPYCQRHYSQIKRYGKIIHVECVKHGVKICSFCNRVVDHTYKTDIGFLCSTHYNYYKKHGHLNCCSRKNKNEIIDNGDGTSCIILYDRNLVASSKCVIDTEDVSIVCNYRWQKTSFNYVSSATDKIWLHRLIMGLDKNDKRVVDHINGDKLDNRKSNLRICTHQQNVWHKVNLSKNNTSGVLGVHYSKERKKWVAQIRVNGKHVYLGRYECIEDAISARKNAEIKYFGDYNNTIRP